jgi:hypothetical protein
VPVNNISTEITTARWTKAQVDTEVAFLRSYLGGNNGFNRLLSDVPSAINGVNVNGVVVTDNASRFPSGTWSSSEQVRFNAADGIIYVGLNPNNTGQDQLTGRVLSVGELIAHGLGHYTQQGLDAIARDPFSGIEAEIVATSYANSVGRDYGLSPLTAFRVSNFNFGPLFCSFDNPTGAGPSPRFLSNCFAPGTLIATPGRQIPIEAIQINTVVLAFDSEENLGAGPLVPRRVLRLFESLTTEWLILRSVDAASHRPLDITVTPGHLFLTQQGTFRRIDEILSDDSRVILLDGSAVEVAADRITYSRETAHLFEEAELIEFGSIGGLALAPKLKKVGRPITSKLRICTLTSPAAFGSITIARLRWLWNLAFLRQFTDGSSPAHKQI